MAIVRYLTGITYHISTDEFVARDLVATIVDKLGENFNVVEVVDERPGKDQAYFRLQKVERKDGLEQQSEFVKVSSKQLVGLNNISCG